MLIVFLRECMYNIVRRFYKTPTSSSRISFEKPNRNRKNEKRKKNVLDRILGFENCIDVVVSVRVLSFSLD